MLVNADDLFGQMCGPSISYEGEEIMREENGIPRIPSISDREYFRVDGLLYLYSEPVEMDSNNTHDSQGLYIPTFVQEEDDFVGLSIDAFRERVILDRPPEKDSLLEVQQLMSMMKRFFDAENAGRKQKMYKKILVNLSGSGMAFPSDVAYHVGQVLRLSIFFPAFPFTYVSVAADVVRSEKAEIGYEIKVQFKDISDKTRDEILKFVNQCQREKIRK